MKTLLVITPQTALASAIGAVVDPSHYRIVHKTDLREDELSPFSVDICILDAELTTIEPIRLIERARRCLPNRPLVLFSSLTQWEWEEEAYLMGVSHVLRKPVRGRLLNALLERLSSQPKSSLTERQDFRPRSSFKPQEESTPISRQTLELLRNCSSILTHSLCADSLLKEFLLLIREIIGVNRAAIFLRQAPGTPCESPSPERSRRLRAAYAIGLLPGLIEHFELSLEAGIGGYLLRTGRIVRQHSNETDYDPQIQKEFEILSAQVAIPILDRESFLGLAVFDGRLTGEPLTNEELSLLFHLLEQLGMAIKNIWLHEQIAANHDMLGGVLSELTSACVVVGSDLTILHANDTARQCFPRKTGRRQEVFEFNNLPQPIASKVFEVIKSGKGIAPFRYQPESAPNKVFQITIAPFKKKDTGLPTSVLLVGEDFSHMERIGQLETEAANLRVVKQMAKRLAHEIGNAIVPISTYQQLMCEPIKDPEAEKTLASAMKSGINRVSRLVTQMRFLANDRLEVNDRIQVKQLIEDAFHEARAHHPATGDLLKFETTNESMTLTGNRVGLHHAFSEILINALQANGSAPTPVRVKALTETIDGANWAHIEIHDAGEGFSQESASKASLPFFTTRNVGLGLGLAVTHKIIETHKGRLEIPEPHSGKHGMIRVSLPMVSVPSTNGSYNGNGTNGAHGN